LISFFTYPIFGNNDFYSAQPISLILPLNILNYLHLLPLAPLINIPIPCILALVFAHCTKSRGCVAPAAPVAAPVAPAPVPPQVAAPVVPLPAPAPTSAPAPAPPAAAISVNLPAQSATAGRPLRSRKAPAAPTPTTSRKPSGRVQKKTQAPATAITTATAAVVSPVATTTTTTITGQSAQPVRRSLRRSAPAADPEEESAESSVAPGTLARHIPKGDRLSKWHRAPTKIPAPSGDSRVGPTTDLAGVDIPTEEWDQLLAAGDFEVWEGATGWQACTNGPVIFTPALVPPTPSEVERFAW
jgi:hypothetical protein